MEKFVISSDDCHILKAFKEADSLRQAAQILNCDPAGLVRRVQTLANENGFLQKVNNRWRLTNRGVRVVAWAEESIQSQKHILDQKRNIRIASTMWFLEQVLIRKSLKLAEFFDEQAEIQFSVPFKGFENALMDGSVDYVVVCHPPESPDIEHRQVCPEKWVVIYPKIWKKNQNERNGESFLRKKPFIRHSDMNLDLFLSHPPLEFSPIQIDNLISIRSAVENGIGWSLVPELLIGASHDRIAISTESVSLADRKVCLWWLRRRSDLKKQSVRVMSWLRDS